MDRGFTDRGFTDRGFTDRGFTDQGFTDRGFVDSGRRYPGTHADPSQSRLSSDPAPAHPPPAGVSGFPLEDQVYLEAGSVFQRLRTDRPVAQRLLHYGKKETAELPGGLDKSRRRQAYQLAFNALKYQHLLEDVVVDSCFTASQQIPDDLLPLAMVMLFDLQDRKFQLIKRPAKNGEERLQDVRDLESCFRRSKTKLAASLARFRVKQNLLSVSCVLPDQVRANQNRAKRLPFYAWVNTLESSVEEVCEELQAGLGLREAERSHDGPAGLAFCRDPLCADTLSFPPQLHARIQHSALTAGHVLHMQHRAVCLVVSALHPHLQDNSDLLVAGHFSAGTLAHIAVRAAARSGRVLVCGGDHTASQREEMQELLARMDIKNVRVLPGDFQGLDEWDGAAGRLRLILLLPRSSCSALADPVQALLTEHGDLEVLQDLCQGAVSQSKLDTLTHHQDQLLGHALTFPKVQTVLYCTCSVYPQENQQLVKRALDKTVTPPRVLPFRPARPLLPETPASDTTDNRFFRMEPSDHTDGCFIARLTRESNATKVESVQNVLARAAAKGLLGAMFGDQSQPGQRARRRKGNVLPANQKSYSPLPGLAETESGAGGGRDLDPDPGADQDPGTRADQDPGTRPVTPNTPPTVERDDGDAEEKEENVEEANEDIQGGRPDMKKASGRRKGRAKPQTKRSQRTSKVSAVEPNGTGRKTLKMKVKRTHRLGPQRGAAAEQVTPTQSLTPWSGPPGPIPHPQGSTPVRPAAHTLQMSHKEEQQGQKAHAKKPLKKAAPPGGIPPRAASGGEEVSQDPAPPVDLLQPLVSSFRESSLSNRASSQSMEPSSSTTTPPNPLTPGQKSSKTCQGLPDY